MFQQQGRPVLMTGESSAEQEWWHCQPWQLLTMLMQLSMTAGRTWGTGAMAPPGALTTTPPWPSGVGPLEDQVYCWPCSVHTPLTN